MSKQKQQPEQPEMKPSLPSKVHAPEKQERLVISIQADDELLDELPTLATKCKTLLFTSSDRCQSMEQWQRIFEANGFRFVKNTYDPSVRSQLYESLK